MNAGRHSRTRLTECSIDPLPVEVVRGSRPSKGKRSNYKQQRTHQTHHLLPPHFRRFQPSETSHLGKPSSSVAPAETNRVARTRHLQTGVLRGTRFGSFPWDEVWPPGSVDLPSRNRPRRRSMSTAADAAPSRPYRSGKK